VGRRDRLIVSVAVLLLPISALAQKTASVQASTRNIDQILGIPSEERGKCGTSALMLALTQWQALQPATKQAVLLAVQRVPKHKSRVSQSGRFRVHYDTAGVHVPALITSGPNGQRISGTAEKFVDSVATYFEKIWTLEIDSLRLEAPPSDGVQGGGPEYDIYVEELGTDMFGETSWNLTSDLIENGVRQRFSTYITVDNDFVGYRTPGMDGLRVTAAHEFFHAIQVGSYGVWTNVPSSNFYFYELSSVWMEHLAFPHIHDYYYYLPKYFLYYRDGQDRSYPFTLWDGMYRGYERAVWAFFLSEKFGRDVIREIWSGMKQSPVLPATTSVLARRGTTLEREFAHFGLWNFYTGDRADPTRSYAEGASFPRYKPNVSMDFFGNQAVIRSAAPAMSMQMYQFTLSGDTVTAIVTNRDAASAQNSSPPFSDVSLAMRSSGFEPPYQLVAPGIGVSLKSPDLAKLNVVYLRSSTKENAIVSPGPSPNPLRLATDARLLLPLTVKSMEPVDVYVLNSAAEKVFERRYQSQVSFGMTAVEIPVSDLRAELATGVFFFIARTRGEEHTWKVAVIR